jgi:hypothetical protein
VAPSTTASYIPNLITTPEVGLDVGNVSVWNINNFSSAGMGDMSSGSADKPALMTAYQPFTGAVNIAATYQAVPGGQAKPVIVAWQTPYMAAFTGIDLDDEPITQWRVFSTKK